MLLKGAVIMRLSTGWVKKKRVPRTRSDAFCTGNPGLQADKFSGKIYGFVGNLNTSTN